ncbi:MAG: UDP-N-acetylmuramate--L-alanine ligase [Desulfovibrionaceae bacterium]|nr:UDP-N-acetylmuramate--L-alanine ligase [Desulfovibrionaceae bacterium]
MHKKIRQIHMIGIGGAGMSGIAEVLLNLGYEISGSDLHDSAMVQHLRSLGANIAIGHAAANIPNVQVVVKSTAIRDDNPEIVEARRRNLAIIPRAEMLAELMRLRTGIAIAGTHGKTTTTSLTATIFDLAGLDPTVVIGGRLNVYGTNAHLGHGEYIIVEADESDASFLCLFPVINVVTNVDCDHLDHYKTPEAIDDAFVQYMNKIPFYGLNVVCGDDPGVLRLLPRVKRPVLTYGFAASNDLRAILLEKGLTSRFAVWYKDTLLGECLLPQPGLHNILNALASIAVAHAAEIPFEACVQGLAAFKGVGRRFEYKGMRDDVIVIDDYGHHPTEIAATLATARLVYPDRRLIVAFQPHRFSRTQAHFGEFCKVFGQVDLLLLTEIYAASETPIPGITGQNLAIGVQQVTSTSVYYFRNLTEMKEGLKAVLKPGDLLLTLGAGTITKLGPMWLEDQN